MLVLRLMWYVSDVRRNIAMLMIWENCVVEWSNFVFVKLRVNARLPLHRVGGQITHIFLNTRSLGGGFQRVIFLLLAGLLEVAFTD